MQSHHPKTGLVVGKFAPLHRGHQLLIEHALASCDRLYLWTWSNPDFPSMPDPVRRRWLQTLYPNAHVLPQAPASPPNTAPDHEHQNYVARTLKRWNIHIDTVFSSEHYGAPLAAKLNATHNDFDIPRQKHSVSGTQIRADIHTHRTHLHPFVYGHFIKKIAFLGAESTGKSTLCKHLAHTTQSTYVPEYGREVFEDQNGTLLPHHFVDIARGHRQRETQAQHSPGVHRFLFCDTNAMTTAAFSFMIHGFALPELLQHANACATRYAHTFVCDTDIAFQQDGWRANTDVRKAHQGLLLYELNIRNIPYTLLKGSLEERTHTALETLNALPHTPIRVEA